MYAEHFGFSKLPFGATPDPQVFFNNSLYREAFAKLQHGVLAKKGFVVITGEVGTGKTTLLRKLLHSLGPTVHSVFILNTQVSFVELLRLILDDLNLAPKNDDKLAMIEILNQYLIERLRQGHIVALLIDEAQNLCDEALEGLRLLSKLETDSEKLLQIVLVGQPELEIKLDQLKLRQLKQRMTLQCRLAPLKKQEMGAYIEFRLNAVGFRGKNPFHPASLEAIAFYSKGIPRLVNIICDRALLIAYAASKGQVSAQIVEEVARGLQLGPPRAIEAGHPVHHKMPETPVKSRIEEQSVPEFENSLIGAQKQHRPEFRWKHSLAGVGVGIFVGAVFLGLIAVSDSQQSQIYLSEWTLKVRDFFQRTDDSIAGLAAWTGEAVRPPWNTLMHVTPITETSEDNSSTAALADSNDANPSKRIHPSFGHPAPVDEKPSLISQEPKEAGQDKKLSLPGAAKPAETQIARDTRPPTERPANSDGSKAQEAESRQLSSLKPEPGSLEGPNQGEAPYLGKFQVIEDSFVRDTPESDAAIITTLQPGSSVRVESKIGKYFLVRALNNTGVHGYVHEEDAFFKRIK
jgi:general secretion pathway protein A